MINFKTESVQGTAIPKGKTKCHAPSTEAEDGSLLSEQSMTLADLTRFATQTIFGSSRIRHGLSPDENEQLYMTNIVAGYVAKNIPIQAVSVWAGLKCYGLSDEHITTDWADKLAMKRLKDLNLSIQKMYLPGWQVKIIFEDVGEIALNRHCANIEEKMSRYYDDLQELADETGCVSFHRESRLLALHGFSPGDFRVMGLNNTAPIYEYLIATMGTPDAQKHEVPSYEAVQQLGWQGIIPDEQRTYYLDRVQVENPDMNMLDRLHQVAHYLGLALTRHKLGFYKSKFPELPPVKVAFNPNAPGTPSQCRLGRVEYKLQDDKNNKKHLSPWSSYSVRKAGFNPNVKTLMSVGSLVQSTKQL